MIKVFLILIFVFSVLACKPAEEKASENVNNYPFSCLPSQSDCNLDTELGHLSITFSGLTEQGKLKTELPFQIQLQLTPSDQSHQLSSIQSYLEGKTMFMGKVPVFFEHSETSNVMLAQTLLASCSEEVMTWRLWLTIDIAMGDEIKQESIFIDFDSMRL
ncbi:MAG: hypothetical protein OQK09_00130 [Colwellia sp.]|nr:hypothetical protein [Colwellia sp.]MCW8865389.1 hypothetical protein [Colwellia sp.]MCW9079893.1 hypothetical protein [Colwellia sp.]